MDSDTTHLIRSCISNPRAYEIPIGVFNCLLQAGVYVYLNGNVALYVGASGKSFKRTLAHNHAARPQLDQSTSVLFIPCKDKRAARVLELRLIADLQPAGNNRGRRFSAEVRQVADALGMLPQCVAVQYQPENTEQNRALTSKLSALDSTLPIVSQPVSECVVLDTSDSDDTLGQPVLTER